MLAKLLAATSRLTLATAIVLQPIAQAHGQSVVINRAAGKGTGLDVTPQGVPIVNIAAPNGAGVSHNVYTSFGAGPEGLILNNSAGSVDTALGGTILGNPNLSRSRAKADLILNEVTGGTRSQIMGAIEIAGQGAELVIANPFGITCNGCGFINTPRVILSTGRPEFGADGALAGLRVEGGDVLVTGGGLLAGSVDFFDIVAGSARINADLFARNLIIAGGKGRYDVAARTTSGNGGTGIVIDSAALGGMYANRIRLIGTGDGVGINLSGTVASLQGDLEITTTGQLALRSALGEGSVTVAADRVTLSEQLYAGGSASLSGREVAITGALLGAQGDISIAATNTAALADARVYAGLSRDGEVGATGSLSLSGGDLALAASELNAGARLVADARSLALDEASRAVGGDTALTLGRFDNSGLVAASRTLNLRAGDLHNQATGLVYAGARATIGLGTGRNDGALLAAGDLSLGSAGDIGSNGRLAADGMLDVAATGRLAIGGDAVGGSGLSFAGTGAVELAATASVRSGGGAALSAGGDMRVNGELAAAGEVSLAAGRDLAVAGALLSNGSVGLVAGRAATLSGVFLANGDAVVGAGTVGLSGAITARRVELSATGDVSVDGSVQAGAGGAWVAAGGLLGGIGSVEAVGAILAQAGRVDFGGDLVSNAGLRIAAEGDLVLRGALATLENASLQSVAGSVALARGSRLDAIGGASLTAAAGLSVAGAVTTDADLSVRAGGLLDLSGALSSRGATLVEGGAVAIGGRAAAHALTVRARGDLTLSGEAVSGATAALGAGGDLRIAGDLFTVGGLVATAGGDLALTSTGVVETGTAVALSGRDLVLGGSLISGGPVDLTLAGAARIGGMLSAEGAVRLAADAIVVDTAGTLESGGLLDLSAGSILSAGRLFGAERLEVRGRELVYLADGSRAVTAGALRVNTPGELRVGGEIRAKDGIDLAAGGTALVSGSLATNGILTLSAARAAISGTMRAGGSLVVNAEADLAITGELRSAGLLASAGSVELGAASVLLSGGAVALDAGAALLSTGRIESGGAFSLVSGGALASTGTLLSRGNAVLSAAGSASVAGSLAALATSPSMGRTSRLPATSPPPGRSGWWLQRARSRPAELFGPTPGSC